ncbi:hypothetical protein [Methylobacterium planeticum]|uniref:Uncharacterized protein n=1 Tax=Methylobacterium planeticum TaxID=2615211 RepID=A0A6N6MPB4_9HYPH|nr:hypothetical protein [Methylobacterium planeticum]KAB1071791.1 hypothetical protein F6X51_18455 [Methylobacterium planeticum]
MLRAGLIRLVKISARRLGLRRRSRVAPGPLRVVDRRTGPSAAGGALFGGLLALAVLAALSLPLVFARGSAPDAQAEAEVAFVGAASDEAPQPGQASAQAAAPEPVRVEAPAPADAPARVQSASAEAGKRGGIDLPVLEAAAEAEAPPVAAPVPAKPAPRKSAARKPATSVARASP